MTNTGYECRHNQTEIGDTAVVACQECGTVEWWHAGGLLDPAEGMARVFGQYDFVEALPAVRTPAPTVLVYAAPNRRSRRALSLFPAGVWMEAHPGMWITSDGEHLLIAPADPLLAANLVRRA